MNYKKNKKTKGCFSKYNVVAVNPNMFSYYVEVSAPSLIRAAEIGLQKLSKKYPGEKFSRIEVGVINQH